MFCNSLLALKLNSLVCGLKKSLFEITHTRDKLSLMRTDLSWLSMQLI